MNNAIKGVFIFALGAAAGTIVSWKLLETKYEKLYQEEKASLEELYSRKMEELDKKGSDEEENDQEAVEEAILEEAEEIDEEYDVDIEDIEEYEKQVERYYPPGLNIEEKIAFDKKRLDFKPYIIEEDEIGSEPEYELISLNYYSDGVLTDDWNELMEDVDNTVGQDPLKILDSGDKDVVYVRNNRLKADYEIVANVEKFSDIDPHLMEE